MDRKELDLENHVKDDSYSTFSFPNCNQSRDDSDILPLDYEDNSYEYYEPTDNELAADYEDDAYEYSEPNSEEANANNNLTFSPDDDYIHSTLVQRYNQETGQTAGLRNQAVFTLTALGFLVTIGIGIMGANWFNLPYLIPHLLNLNLVWYILVGLPMVACITNALRVLWKVELNSSKHYWKYPDDGYLNICKSTTVNLGINKRQDCRSLAEIITHNSEKNEKHRRIMIKGDIALFISFIWVIIIIIYILFLSYPQ